MLLLILLKDFPSRAEHRWKEDVGSFGEEQWKEAMQVVQLCSLNVTQWLSQLYILLRVHLTPERLLKMGKREDPMCTRCLIDNGDLIHLL